MSNPVQLELGIKADPIEYRYSYAWLFRLMASENIRHLQLGTFFEIYQLPDQWFIDLRAQAADHGVQLTSIFTAHRELGGFFRREIGWEHVARRNFERLIDVGGILGVEHVGSNPGAVLRDSMESKAAGTACYIRNMRELMHRAHDRGLKCLCIEPMSCLAEPPTLPDEIDSMAQDLMAYHAQHPSTTTPIGYCADVSHGYANADGEVIHDNLALFKATFPYLAEVHLKNTDARFDSTFGFSEPERKRGIVDLAVVRDMLLQHATELPLPRIVCYLEIGGPKLGRDYSDIKLESVLRDSLQHIKSVFNH